MGFCERQFNGAHPSRGPHQPLDLDKELPTRLGSGDIVHELLKDRMVDFDGKTWGVGGVVGIVGAGDVAVLNNDVIA